MAYRLAVQARATRSRIYKLSYHLTVSFHTDYSIQNQNDMKINMIKLKNTPLTTRLICLTPITTLCQRDNEHQLSFSYPLGLCHQVRVTPNLFLTNLGRTNSGKGVVYSHLTFSLKGSSMKAVN
jgi:hypothetical protein